MSNLGNAIATQKILIRFYQQLELLDNYPMFTRKCPQCGVDFDRNYTARVHWD
ncbi:MAG: hypothetical protein ACFCUV_00455 [Rivularia sp. (in: cyanobacteria)]